MARSSKKAGQQQGVAGRPELDWSGQLEARGADGVRRCTVARDDAGWLLVVHGAAVNDEGTSYEWSRQELDAVGHPVRHADLEDALALVDELVAQFDDEHASAEEQRRLDEAIAAGTAPYEVYTVEQLRDQARERGLIGFSSATKGELIVMLEADDEQEG